MTDSLPLRSRVLTGLVGAAVPSMVFGKAGIAAVVLIAFVLAVPDLVRPRVWRAVGRHVGTPVGWATLVTAVLWLPGVLFSIAPQLSFEAWARTWVFVVVALIFWQVLAASDGLRDLALRVFVVATAVVLAMAAFGFAVPPFLALIHAHGWTEGIPERALKAFASAAMLMIPVALWAAFRLRRGWRVVAVAEAAGLLWLMVATESRSSMAGVLAMVGVVAAATVLRDWSRRTLLGVGAAVVIGSSAILGWLYSIPHFPWAPGALRGLDFLAPVWLIDLPRQKIWAFTWQKVLESPWIGHGINAVNYLPGANDYVPEMGYLAHIPGHPHNWALEVLAETGAVGFVPLVVVVGLLLFRLLLMYRRTHDPAFLAAACVHTGYWVSGLFNFSFWSAWWQVSYVLLLALTYPGRYGSAVPPCREAAAEG